MVVAAVIVFLAVAFETEQGASATTVVSVTGIEGFFAYALFLINGNYRKHAEDVRNMERAHMREATQKQAEKLVEKIADPDKRNDGLVAILQWKLCEADMEQTKQSVGENQEESSPRLFLIGQNKK